MPSPPNAYGLSLFSVETVSAAPVMPSVHGDVEAAELRAQVARVMREVSVGVSTAAIATALDIQRISVSGVQGSELGSAAALSIVPGGP